ncbi:MAG: 16S rRNA (cytosine(1402)-N(4))-methyltransferase RsmH [Treponema sp.]|jgi:16S rRNA (cytosine1402-N4)-methyltransferase|nr:16S rRNA (cytosine(1402)-N(4))-methyltransferase RsmH [Treponema sp.]
MESVHTPVLLEETLEYLKPRGKNELMVDATLGEGGHSKAFLSKYQELKVAGIDADSNILSVARERLKEYKDRIYYYSGWSQDFFAEYPAELKRPDTILNDLGVSFYHYKKSGKGFSFATDEFLDMRLDVSEGVPAADLIKRLPVNELADLLYNNAGERFSRRIASLIVKERQKGDITTASALASLVERAVPASQRHGPVHPATKTFLALRIAVNGELSRLPNLLEGALRVLEPGGRLGVISFHSLEDKIVKNFFRAMNKNCTCPATSPICNCGQRSVKILTKKGIAPGKAEIERNPPSRSARLRVVEKILDEDGQ